MLKAARKRCRPGRGLYRDRDGLTLLFWAFSFLGIFAFLAIVVDSGLIFVQRRRLQNTADVAALASAQQLFIDDALAIATAEDTAADNTPGLVTNVATVANGQVIASVSKNSASLLPSSGLSFGSPEISASATARLAGSRLPGPGVFCVAVELGEHTIAEAAQGGIDVLQESWADLDPLLTVLRFGGGQSNAGYIDIVGPVNENTRECLRDGSQNPLLPVDQTQTGVSVGQAAQALQDHLEAARARTDNAGGGCFSW